MWSRMSSMTKVIFVVGLGCGAVSLTILGGTPKSAVAERMSERSSGKDARDKGVEKGETKSETKSEKKEKKKADKKGDVRPQQLPSGGEEPPPSPKP